MFEVRRVGQDLLVGTARCELAEARGFPGYPDRGCTARLASPPRSIVTRWNATRAGWAVGSDLPPEP